MPFFKDTAGGLHFLSEIDIANGGEELLPIGCVPITDSEAAAINAPTLTQSKVSKRLQIEQWRDAARYANVTVTVNGASHIWQIDPISKDLILDAADNNQIRGIPLPPTWRTADNIDVPITLADLNNIIAAGSQQTLYAYSHSWALKAQVDAATTQSQLDAITW